MELIQPNELKITTREETHFEVALPASLVSSLIISYLRSEGLNVPRDAEVGYPEQDFNALAYVAWNNPKEGPWKPTLQLGGK